MVKLKKESLMVAVSSGAFCVMGHDLDKPIPKFNNVTKLKNHYTPQKRRDCQSHLRKHDRRKDANNIKPTKKVTRKDIGLRMQVIGM